MIGKVLAKIFGTQNERDLKRIAPLVEQVNALEPEMQRLTDEQFRMKTDEFRARIKARLQEAEAEISRVSEEIQSAPDDQRRGEMEELNKRRLQARNQALDEILPEAFAVAREAGRRVLNMRHFDVQVIGGVVLHRGRIAEMKTGEGKTLVDAMRDGTTEGMQHFDAELERMVRAGILDLSVALSYATNAGNLRLEMADLAEASPITA